jgi:hypothetical protein
MSYPLLEKGNDMWIIHEVKNFFSDPAGFHQVHLTQTAHVMGYCRFRNPDQFSQ